MEEYKTLADTFKEYDDLPPWLVTHGEEEDEEKAENATSEEEIEEYYESIYASHLGKIKFDESRKGALETVRAYCTSTPKDEWSFEDFSEKFKDKIEEFGLKKEDYTRTVHGIESGAIKLSRNSKDDIINIEDDRPDFDPDTSDDPVMASIFKFLNKEQTSASVEEEVNRKYHELYECARNIANARSTNSHAVIGGAPGVGKTWTIGPAIDDGLAEWKPNRRHQNKPQRIDIAGSIGTSMTDVLETFYKNRHEKLILLDDADGFLNGSNQDLANMMKVFLGPVKEARIPGGIRKNIQHRADEEAERAEVKRQKELEKEKGTEVPVSEGLNIFVDTSRLAEGKLSVSSDYARCTVRVPFNEAVKLGAKFGYKPFREQTYYDPLHRVDAYIDHLGLYRESDQLNPDEEKLLDEIDKVAKNNQISDEAITAEEIPEKFFFDSNLVVITNLHFADLDESMQAVISRCDTVELYLTKEEYLCRSEQIIPDMKIGLDSVNSPAILEWAKRESFVIFKTLLIGSSKFKNFTVQINQRLDFRLLGKIANKLLLRMYDYADSNNLELDDIVNSPEQRCQMEVAVRDVFIADLIAFLKQRT